VQLEQRPALVSAAATAAAAAAASPSAPAAATVSPKQDEWVARRTRHFSFSEMFNDGNDGDLELTVLARDRALAADAGVATERMEKFIARAKGAN
jgi:hypothetical protein